MAFTYKWKDLITVVGKYRKGLPMTDIDAQICDFVSSDMYAVYPWKDTLQSLGPAQSLLIPLQDGVQDYDPPANIWRLTKGWIARTDTTPAQYRDLDLSDDIPIDLIKRSFYSIKSCSLQPGVGKIRLECAVSVPTGTLLEFQAEWQPSPTKITSTDSELWFRDQYATVAIEGLIYWAYKLADDARAGTVAADGRGRATYTGQYGIYKNALNVMQQAEDYGSLDSLFPAEALGKGRDYQGLNIFGW